MIDKAHENRVRRKADRQGLTLTKSRVRDPDAPHFGVWTLTRITTHGNVREVAHGTLDAIEQHLTRRST
jgi:hypothetical protein